MAAFKKLYRECKVLKDASPHLSELAHVAEEDADALGPEHVIIDHAPRHHGMQDRNPLDFVKFYSKHNPNRESILSYQCRTLHSSCSQRACARTLTMSP